MTSNHHHLKNDTLRYALSLASIGIVSVTSCYNPDFADGGFSCIQDDKCPSGYKCFEHDHCVRENEDTSSLHTITLSARTQPYSITIDDEPVTIDPSTFKNFVIMDIDIRNSQVVDSNGVKAEFKIGNPESTSAQAHLHAFLDNPNHRADLWRIYTNTFLVFFKDPVKEIDSISNASARDKLKKLYDTACPAQEGKCVVFASDVAPGLHTFIVVMADSQHQLLHPTIRKSLHFNLAVDQSGNLVFESIQN